MGISPDEDLTSYVHVAHGLEVSSQTNRGVTNTELLSDNTIRATSLVILEILLLIDTVHTN
jgi:hypothetical protein